MVHFFLFQKWERNLRMIYSHVKFVVEKKGMFYSLYVTLNCINSIFRKKLQYTPAPALPKFAPLPHSHKKIQRIAYAELFGGWPQGVCRGCSGAMGGVVGGRW
jgi:hypothetical protein